MQLLHMTQRFVKPIVFSKKFSHISFLFLILGEAKITQSVR